MSFQPGDIIKPNPLDPYELDHYRWLVVRTDPKGFWCVDESMHHLWVPAEWFPNFILATDSKPPFEQKLITRAAEGSLVSKIP